MLNNIKYISFNFVTFNKKAMKKLTVILIVISINCSGQLANTLPYGEYNWGESKGAGLAIGIAVSGFAVNETMSRTDIFHNKTVQQKNNAMLTGYVTTAVLSIGTAILFPIINENIKKRKKHKKRHNFTFKFI